MVINIIIEWLFLFSCINFTRKNYRVNKYPIKCSGINFISKLTKAEGSIRLYFY